MSAKRPGKKPARKRPVDAEAVAAKRERRAKAAALRAQQERARRRRTMLRQVGVVSVIALVALGIAFAVVKGRAPGYAAPPPGFDKQGDITVGNTDAPVTVTLVEDFSCPFCAATTQANKDLLASYAAGDDVRLDYRPIAFLDEKSDTDYSTRALNAAVCVVGDDPSNWSAMHESLMANQPPEGGSGLSDDRLVELATEAGADPDTVTTCVDDLPHEDWIDYTTHRVTNASDFAGTPGIFVNDKRLKSPTAEAIDAAVQAALAK